MRVLLFFTSILLLLGVASAEPLAHKSQNRYGPNLGHAAFLELPLGSAAHTFKEGYRFSFTWLEPLGINEYYSEARDTEKFFRFQSDVELSHSYGMFSADFGLRLFPFLSCSMTFRHNQYFLSNVEMGLGDKTEVSILDSWRGDYIEEHKYDRMEPDFIQYFDLNLYLDFKNSLFSSHTRGTYSLVDVTTNQNGKSYDYLYQMPVFERDYLQYLVSDLSIPVGKSDFDINLEGEYLRTGFFIKDQDKQPLEEMRFRIGAGLHPQGRDLRHSLLFDIGLVYRDDAFFEGDLADQMLFRITWEFNHLLGQAMLEETRKETN
jgi:hypothetical protein